MSQELARHSAPFLHLVDEADTARPLTKRQRDKQQALTVVVRHLRELRAVGATDSLRPACEAFARSFAAGCLPPGVTEALTVLRPTRSGQCPDRATLYRWDQRYTAYLAGQMAAAAPQQRGRQRRVYGWEARAIHLWQQPTKPAMSTVAYWLRGEGHDSATDSRVRRYLKSLPAQVGAQSPTRMGQHYHRQNLRPYVLRDSTVLPVGFVYQGDGHTCDVYVAHPATGKPWRPEFTPWLDVRSHYCVGWWLSEAESAITTLYSLSHALLHHDHVPALIHVDPGSGFKNRMMNGTGNDAVTGYLDVMSIEFMAALPGNAKGKGLVEGFFHIFEERCGKRFNTYCGHVRTDDYLRHLSAKVKRGQIKLPTLGQYRDAIAAYIDRYNNTYQDALGGTPAELWAQLERTPVEVGPSAIVRPRQQRTVRRGGVSLDKRLYRHPALADHLGATVVIEYDLHDDATVVIRDAQDRFICEAYQVERKPWMEASRIEQAARQRKEGQIRRKQRDIEEIEARAGFAIEGQRARLEAIEQLAEPLHMPEEDTPDADPSGAPEIDPFDLNY